MKRILGIIFLLFFGICGTVGGAALFSGCSQSQVENGGGGTSSPSEDETTENPNKNDETEGQGCNYDFTVKNYVYTSTSGYAATASSTSSSTGAKASFLYIGLIMEKMLIGGIYLRQRVDIMQFLMDHLNGVVEKYQAAVKHMLDH